jgi:hypothetical protein
VKLGLKFGAALSVLQKILRAEDRLLEDGYKEYCGAISSPPYPGLKGLGAVRAGLVDSTPRLRNADLRKYVDDRFKPGSRGFLVQDLTLNFER